MSEHKFRLAASRSYKQAMRAYAGYTRRPTLATRWKYVQKFAEYRRALAAWLRAEGFDLEEPSSFADPFYARTDWLEVV